MGEDMILRKTKWEKYAGMVDTSTSSKRATFALTAAHALDLMGTKREGLMLDIGCGFGEIDVLLAQTSNFTIIGCDISKRCVDAARENVRFEGLDGRIKVEEGDVYNLSYTDNRFDIVVSFGYTSAATYKGVQGEVARVLKPGGLFICDFTNHLSLYKIMSLRRRWRKLVHQEGKHYNSITVKGIENYFARYNLRMISHKLFNSYPPVNFLSARSLIFFDKTLGRVLHKIFARVRIVCFQKV